MACLYNAQMHLPFSMFSARQAQHHARRSTQADRLAHAIGHTFLIFAGDSLFKQPYHLCL